MTFSPDHKPTVQLIGDVANADFRDAIELLRRDATLVAGDGVPPEVVIVAQSRPDAICRQPIEQLRRATPLAGVVTLLGSWCEGEARTGRPWPGVHRLYWYEFPAWWRRQMRLRAEDRCPDWARVPDFGFRIEDCGLQFGLGQSCSQRGVVVLRTIFRATADTLSDILKNACYATMWQPLHRRHSIVRGAIAGVWDGAQLSDDEANELAEFSAQLRPDAAPVLALLDFPRRDRVDQALAIGAAAVVAKPWLNAELIATIDALTKNALSSRAVA
jgi:hypothetical protein